MKLMNTAQHQGPTADWRLQDYTAILFDCDGTLADTMPAHYRAWLHVTKHHGILFDEDRFYALGGRQNTEQQHAMPNAKIWYFHNIDLTCLEAAGEASCKKTRPLQNL